MTYLKELCGPLIEDRVDYTLFYEVKANLTRAQLKTLAHAGVRYIQPGIESLSTHVLGLMRKGTTMLKNVRLLKWARYYDIQVAWNVLTGFPGEQRDDYTQQEQLVPLLLHLEPPIGCGPIWLERFSPYFFEADSPVRHVRPRAAYSHIYPPGSVDLERIAYYFDYDMEGALPEQETEGLRAQVSRWRESWKSPSPPSLVYQRAPDWVQVVDQRIPAEPRVHALRGVDALVHEACAESEQTASRIVEQSTGEDGERALDESAVLDSLSRLTSLGLLLEERGHFLALAIPVNPNW